MKDAESHWLGKFCYERVQSMHNGVSYKSNDCTVSPVFSASLEGRDTYHHKLLTEYAITACKNKKEMKDSSTAENK